MDSWTDYCCAHLYVTNTAQLLEKLESNPGPDPGKAKSAMLTDIEPSPKASF